MGAGASRVLLAGFILLVPGCSPSGDPLTIATPWPAEIRRELESSYLRESGDARPIAWVVPAPGARLARTIDRRGGVDVLLGGSIWEYGRLAESGRLDRVDSSDPAPWRTIRRPEEPPRPSRVTPGGETPGEYADPRDDPATFADAKATLEARGWAVGYPELVRRASRGRPALGHTGGPRSALSGDRDAVGRPEGVALPRGGREPERARRFLRWLASRGLVAPPEPEAPLHATADGLLADLLGAAVVDAREELRDADAAIRRSAHPEAAEGAIGERPPWPPASILGLRAEPSGLPLLETLLDQVAPDPEVRAWLKESWARPRRPVDGAVLAELAGAVDGRLAREPRFRAWLRGEWTAWTRQLYRRVARVAGGWTPS